MCADDGVLATQHPAVIHLFGSEVMLKLVQRLFEAEIGRFLAQQKLFECRQEIRDITATPLFAERPSRYRSFLDPVDAVSPPVSTTSPS
jgi:hypothetical protein